MILGAQSFMMRSIISSSLSRRSLLHGPAAMAGVTPKVGVLSRRSGSDDTASFRNLLSDGNAVVIVPPGTWGLRPDKLRLPSNTSIIGYGRSSVLRRIGSGTMLRISGTSSEDRVNGCLVRDIVFDGGDGEGTLLETSYADDLVCDNVWWRSNAGIALDIVELWDSRFLNNTWAWCSGIDGASPSVRIRCANPSRENTNAVDFLNCRWEAFRDGAVWLERNGAASMSQIHFTNCKMESSFVRGSFLKITGGNARNIIVNTLYLCGNKFDVGWSTPVDLIDFAPFGLGCIENVSVWLNGPVARTIVRASVGHSSCSIDNLWVDGPHHPKLAIIETVSPIVPSVSRTGYLSRHNDATPVMVTSDKGRMQ
jgi:hypothetical protein